ncbi:hypothetical protein Q5P01_017604 [Channa striata]|uniref:Uncharacterized protein n=1 Tax=Channa striata TaxID=64152 RepID=A0AA88M9S0_CHASR|nr:hypothetical protein Q5P01_017604 [Channa striata]
MRRPDSETVTQSASQRRDLSSPVPQEVEQRGGRRRENDGQTDRETDRRVTQRVIVVGSKHQDTTHRRLNTDTGGKATVLANTREAPVTAGVQTSLCPPPVLQAASRYMHATFSEVTTPSVKSFHVLSAGPQTGGKLTIQEVFGDRAPSSHVQSNTDNERTRGFWILSSDP